MRIDRFVIENRVIDEERSLTYSEHIVRYVTFPVIYDRLRKREIVEINTGDEGLDLELAEVMLTCLNIKCIGEK